MEMTNEEWESEMRVLESTAEELREASSFSRTEADKKCQLELKAAIRQLASKVSAWSVEKFGNDFSWLPKRESELRGMKLLKTESPWTVVLKYPYADLSTIEEMSVCGLHPFIGVPKPGAYLCCATPRKTIRCLVLRVLSESFLRVLNVDNYEELVVDGYTLYHLPKDSAHIHPLCLPCSLLAENVDAKQLWVPKIQDVFKAILEQCDLDVEVIKPYEQDPPKYLVNLMATNDRGRTVDLSMWLSDVLIPLLKGFGPVWRDDVLKRVDNKWFNPFLSGCGAQRRAVEDELSGDWTRVSLPSSCSLRCSTAELDELLSSSFEKSLSVKPLLRNDRQKTDGPIRIPQQPKDDLRVWECRRILDIKRVRLPAIGERVGIRITEIVNPLQFYAMFHECRYADVYGFENMMRRLNDPDGLCKDEPLDRPNVGQLVAFFSKSGVWERGLVMHLGPEDTVNVVDPDLGHCEIVPAHLLRALQPRDRDFPSQAVLIELYNICVASGNVKQTIPEFVKLTANKNLEIIIKKVDRIYTDSLSVELLADDISVNHLLVQSGLYSWLK